MQRSFPGYCIHKTNCCASSGNRSRLSVTCKSKKIEIPVKKLLHTVNQSPFSHKALEQCLVIFAAGDALLFFGDGIYAALAGQPLADQLKDKPCYGIESDLVLRGLQRQTLIAGMQLIDYPDFVRLSTEYDLVQSWY